MMKTVIRHNFSYEVILALLASAVIGIVVSFALSALVMLMPVDSAGVTQANSGHHNRVTSVQYRHSVNRQQQDLRPAVYRAVKMTVSEMNI